MTIDGFWGVSVALAAVAVALSLWRLRWLAAEWYAAPSGPARRALLVGYTTREVVRGLQGVVFGAIPWLLLLWPGQPPGVGWTLFIVGQAGFVVNSLVDWWARRQVEAAIGTVTVDVQWDGGQVHVAQAEPPEGAP